MKAFFPALPFLSFLSVLLVYPLVLLGIAGVQAVPPELNFSYLIWILKITCLQALVSAFFSGVLGLAGALLYTEFSSRFMSLPWRLSGVCFSMPSLIVALSFAGFWGRAGWVGSILNSFIEFEFYGWFAVVAAHVFLNHAIYLRTVGIKLKSLDRTEEMAALSFGMSRSRCFFEMTLPKILPAVKTAFLLSFSYCASSFIIVLLLGGGIGLSTLEVSIYESLKINYDLARALLLASTQLGIGLSIFLLSRTSFEGEERCQALAPALYVPRSPLIKKMVMTGFYLLYSFFILGPFIYLLVDGVQGIDLVEWRTLIEALWASGTLAFGVGFLALFLSLGAAYTLRFSKNKFILRWIELLALGPVFVSSILLSFALVQAFPFALRRHLGGPLLVQAIFCIPFSVRMLAEAFRDVSPQMEYAARALGASALQRFFFIELPLIRPQILSVFLLCVTFSLGEVGSLLLFSAETTQTLPVLLFRLMNRYQFREASGVAFLLVLLVLGMSYFVERRKGIDAVRAAH